MKLKLLLFALLLTSILHTNAQSLVKIANPTSTENLFLFSKGITIGSNFYCNYSSGTSVFSLLKYDGTTATLIPNPTAVMNAYNGVQNNIVEFNGSLYSTYLDPGATYSLAKLTGITLNLIASPSGVGGAGLAQGQPTVYNGNLYFNVQNTALNIQLAKCNGTSITLVPTASATGSNGYNGHLKVFNGNLYFLHTDASGDFKLTQFNGTSNTLFANPTSTGAPLENLFNKATPLGTNLFFPYQETGGVTQLAKFNGTSVTLLNNPDAGNGFDSTECVVMGTNMYWRYSNAAGKFQIAKCDGNTISLIANPDATGSFAYFGNVGTTFAVLNSNFYFTYNDAIGTTSIAKCNGLSVTLLPNLSVNDGAAFPVVYNNNLFANNLNISQTKNLVKWNGTAFTKINNPSTTDDGPFLTLTGLLNGSLLMPYQGVKTSGIVQLAKYTEVLPIKLSNFSVTQKEQTAVLNWASATEINANYFEIERSIDGKNFETIGKITCQKTASNYRFENQIGNAKNAIYYRLKMIDNDGSFGYSDIKKLEIDIKKSTFIYPNPVEGNEIKIRLNYEPTEDINYYIYNTTGTLLQQGKFKSQYLNLNLLTTNSGMYFIKMSNGFESSFIKRQ
jgi:Secretion system C-terminal sorting domain